MSIRLTEETEAEARRVAALYGPTAPVLLVGSAVWVGEGNDLDVVVLCADPSVPRGGKRCWRDYPGEMVAWRHGYVNVICVPDDKQYRGWVYANRILLDTPDALLRDKSLRVALCERLRKEGAAACLSD